jgi:CheY-like chemotaxis protein
VSGLAGARVLVLEDEPLVAMALEDMLVGLGCVVIGPASRVAQALALAEAEPIDAAVLDVNINSGRSFAVADVLRRRGIPYLYATGYGEYGVAERAETVPVIQKPYRQDDIAAGLTALLDSATTTR